MADRSSDDEDTTVHRASIRDDRVNGAKNDPDGKGDEPDRDSVKMFVGQVRHVHIQSYVLIVTVTAEMD